MYDSGICWYPGLHLINISATELESKKEFLFSVRLQPAFSFVYPGIDREELCLHPEGISGSFQLRWARRHMAVSMGDENNELVVPVFLLPERPV